MAKLEAPGVRELDGEVTAAEGVVRSVNSNFMPTIGNPEAPIEFALMADYACPHCQNYHKADFQQFLNDYVLTGQATMSIGLLTGTGGQYSQTASVARCARASRARSGVDELFRLAESMGVSSAFSLSRLQGPRGRRDWEAMRSCIARAACDP